MAAITEVGRGSGWLRIGVAAGLLGLGGCSSLLTEGSSATAGIAGAGLANAITKNGAVTAGIGLGVLAATSAGVKYLEKRVHGAEQDEIARAAGPLGEGEVAPWQVRHDIPIEEEEGGQVTVARSIVAGDLSCKEIVFSVDPSDPARGRAFYTAFVCRDGARWKWASAEPATERWGSLQ